MDITRASRTRASWLLAGAVAAALGIVVTGQQPAAPAVYTAEQAAAGRTAYDAACAACHQPTLVGSNEAPQLAGGNFMSTWRGRTTAELVDCIARTMPPANPGSPTPAAAADIVAYMLQANGATPGTARLTPATAAGIGDVSMRQAPPATTAALPPLPPRANAPAATGAPPGPRGVTIAGEVPNYVSVTDEMLRNPPAGDWLTVRRNYQGWSYSPLNQITRDNVKNLRLAWVWAMNEGGASQPMPVAHNGILYLVHTGNVVQALNGRDGELIWEYRAGPDQGGAMRNMAIYQDKVFVATSDARMLALDARTGEKRWETMIADKAKGFGATTGPIAVNGKLIQGLYGRDRYKDDGCFISAFDAGTGKLAWRFNTVARPEEPGGDTWGTQPMMFRGGGETWIAGSYDPDLNLTYWGTAQAKPWVPASRGMSALDKALYTSSTLALNPDTGKLSWYFQHAPGEALDLDEVFERVLLDDDGRKLVFTIGKPGILWKLDRQTGEFLGHKETVFQNVFDSIDPKTGVPTYRGDILEAKTGQWIPACPSTQGGHNWQAMSYHQPSNLLIIPLSQSCLEISGRVVEFKEGSGGTQADRRFFEMPGTNGNIGKLAAYDVRTMREVWKVRAARVVPDVGALDRRRPRVCRRPRPDLPRLRRQDGAHPLADAPRHLGAGLPDPFSADGKQYIAVTAGLGGGSPRNVPRLLSPEIQHPSSGNALYVFELPE